MPYVAGVDLGTTYSAAAIAGPAGASAVDLSSRATVMPSVVAVRADGEILAGEAAERRLVLEPSRAAREFKRRLGDPTPILLGGVPYGAETLSGHLLRSIVETITEREGEPPAIVALSHPANYGRYKLGLLEEAARVAAIPVVVFVPEPVAAAVHYSSTERFAQGELIGVYDLGGGTFDASIVRRIDGGFEVVGQPDGLDRFGGIDMDEAVLGHVRHVLGDALLAVDGDDPAVVSALARLREECRLAKEVLSGDTDVTIPVMLPGLHTEVRLTRAEFEDMIRPRIRDTIAVLKRTAASAGVEMADLARLLLIGGSSRIPLVGEMVRQATARPVGLDTHPKLSVALGSARVALVSLGETTLTTAAPVSVSEPDVVEPEPEPEPEPAPEPAPVPEPEPEPAPVPEPELELEPEPALPKPSVKRDDSGDSGPSRRVLLGVAAVVIAIVAIVLGITYFGGDGSPSATPAPGSDTTAVGAEPTTSVTETAAPVSTGPLENSDRVLAFYYTPWGTEEFDGDWFIWNDNGASPPDDILSDYYPSLGPYSTNDVAVVNQHFAWFNQAGVGIVGFDWWGAGSREDLQVPMILDAAERYGLKVAFVINEYGGRSTDNLAEAIEYLYAEYGEHPAFYWTDEESPYQGNQAKGLFLLWSMEAGSTGSASPEDWASATEAIHGLTHGGIVLAESTDSNLVVWGGFDGLFYPYDLDHGDFSWARTLPEKAWYVPTVLPGYEKRRQGDLSGFTRSEGTAYSERWDAALGTGVEPTVIAVATFNDWRNGTQIEPAASGRDNGMGFDYSDYGSLGEEGYLDLTAEHVVRLDNLPVVETVPLQISFASSSDHATAYFDGARWVRPTEFSFDSAEGDHREIFWDRGALGATVQQSVGTAEAGDTVRLVFNVQLIPGESDPSFTIDKGCIGTTTVEVYDNRGSSPVLLMTAARQPDDCGSPTTYTISVSDLGIGG